MSKEVTEVNGRNLIPPQSRQNLNKSMIQLPIKQDKIDDYLTNKLVEKNMREENQRMETIRENPRERDDSYEETPLIRFYRKVAGEVKPTLEIRLNDRNKDVGYVNNEMVGLAYNPKKKLKLDRSEMDKFITETDDKIVSKIDERNSLYEALRVRGEKLESQIKANPHLEFQFIVPLRFLDEPILKVLYKIKYQIQKDMPINIDEELLLRSCYDILYESVKNNLPYFTELISYYSTMDPQIAMRIKEFYDKVLVYGNILLNTNIIMAGDKIKFDNQYYYTLASDPEFYFEVRGGKIKIYEKVGGYLKLIPSNDFTIDYLIKIAQKRQSYKNKMIWEEYRKMKKKEEEESKSIIEENLLNSEV